MVNKSILLHKLFAVLPVNETCTWYGTTYKGQGKNARLQPCGSKTVGAGLFCDPAHQYCEYHSICERHKKSIENWDDKVNHAWEL